MNKKLSAIIISLLVLSLSLVGCNKKNDKVDEVGEETNTQAVEEMKETEKDVEDEKEETEKDTEEQVAREIELKKLLGLTSEELMDIKADGLEEKDESGKIRSLNYVEDYFGVKDVETIYYFSDVEDKVTAISLNFGQDVELEKLVDNMKSEMGEPHSEVNNGETSKYMVEWVDKDDVYYTLMDFGEFKEFTVTKN